jgi:hypothetical protein
VRRDISSLKRRTAPGEDGITHVLIHHFSTAAINHLAFLFNSALTLGHFPRSWKQAKVIAILKPRKPPPNPESYRPISLLSALSKLLERVIARRLDAHARRFILFQRSNLVSESGIPLLHNWQESQITSRMGITSKNTRAWYYWTSRRRTIQYGHGACFGNSSITTSRHI